jgi:hypothetical protein
MTGNGFIIEGGEGDVEKSKRFASVSLLCRLLLLLPNPVASLKVSVELLVQVGVVEPEEEEERERGSSVY